MKKVAVIGTGVAGKGIAQVFAAYGFETILKSRTEEALNNAIQNIEQGLSKRNTPEEKDKILGNIKITTDIARLQEAELVVEAVVEDISVKKQLLKQVSNVLSDQAILATNTSSLSVNDMASVLPRPNKFIGIHFFNPVPRMKLVELVRGEKTSDETLQEVESVLNFLQKKAIIVKDSACFIVNRIMVTLLNEAAWELYEGIASAQDIDNAINMGLNHPMGPFALMDLIGLDVVVAIMKNLSEATHDKNYEPCPLLEQMVADNKLGRKTKEGFYEYKR